MTGRFFAKSLEDVPSVPDLDAGEPDWKPIADRFGVRASTWFERGPRVHRLAP